MTPSMLSDLMAIVGDLLGDARGGPLGVLAVLTLVAKYSVDLLRTSAVQYVLGIIERATQLPRGTLRWSEWSQTTRVWVSLAQTFLLTLLPALAVVSWPTALVGALTAAFGTKGLHDTGLLPGKRPTVYEPSIGRGLSLGGPPRG